MGIHPFLAAGVAGGGYVSIAKIIPVLLLVLVWTKLLTWLDKDAPAAHLPREALNIGMLSGLILACALFFAVPYYFAAFPLMLVVLGAEAGLYLALRQKRVGLGDLEGQFKAWLKSFKKKKAVEMKPGQVALYRSGGQALPIPDSESPDLAGYQASQDALVEPLKKNAEQIDLDGRSNTGVSVRYVVDGVAYDGRSVDGSVITYLKAAAALDVEDRRRPQSGSMRVSRDGHRHELRVQTAGSTAGEFMRLVVDPKKRHEFQLKDLGFTEKQLSAVKDSVADNKGIVIVSAPKQMGLTSLMYGVLRGHDAFLQHIQTIEREPEQELEGITQNKLSANDTPAEELKTAGWVISQEPDAILISRIENPKTAQELIQYATTAKKRVYVAMRANSTFESLDQWRKLVGDDNLATQSLTMLINARVLRKLCMACKIGYAPDPATLRKLGINPERVTQLFQARSEPLRDPKGKPIPCDFCNDLHYKGRVGIFELMIIDDEMREAIRSGKPVEQAFRKQRGRFLQEEALALVEKGDTSVQEVRRVLKPEGTSTSAAAKRPAATPGAAAVRKG